MMKTVPHVTSVSGLRKFQADGFLFDKCTMCNTFHVCVETDTVIRKLYSVL